MTAPRVTPRLANVETTKKRPRLDRETFALPAKPLVSVIVPTYNEEEHIVELLDSLAAQDYGPRLLEVLVADGGSTDRTRELVTAYPRVFHRLELIDNPKRITAAGLNIAMTKATGDCWLRIDGHSAARPDFVRQSVEALRRTGAACVGGPIDTVGHGTAGRAIAAAMSSPFGVGDAKFRYSTVEARVDTVPFGCYHRRVWEVIGPFDETVDRADDDDFNARIIEAGGTILLVPEIRSTYYPRQTFAALAYQYWGYGRAKGALFARGRPLRPRHYVPGAALLGGPLLLYLSRKSRFARSLLRMLASAYMISGFQAARRAAREHGAPTPLTLAAMATMHASYGAGFIWGVARERLLGRGARA